MDLLVSVGKDVKVTVEVQIQSNPQTLLDLAPGQPNSNGNIDLPSKQFLHRLLQMEREVLAVELVTLKKVRHAILVIRSTTQYDFRQIVRTWASTVPHLAGLAELDVLSF